MSVIDLDGWSFDELRMYTRYLSARRAANSWRQLANGAVVSSWGNPQDPCLFIISGVHGDERSGPISIIRMLEVLSLSLWCEENKMSVCVCPIVNDLGWDARSRFWGDLDLNRTFGARTSPKFMTELLQEIRGRRLAAFVDLHEDDTVGANYLFRFSGDETTFVDDMASHLGVNVETWASSDGWEGASEFPARKAGAKFVTTTEASGQLQLQDRVTWHNEVLSWLLGNTAKYIHGQ